MPMAVSFFFFSSRRRHTRWTGDWSSDVCSSDLGVPVTDYVAAPFDRAVATPENQFILDSATRVIPASELPPLFPTPVTVTPGAGSLRLTALPRVETTEALRNEWIFATEYLRPYFAGTGTRRGHPPDSDRHLQPAFGSGPLVDRPWGSGFYSHADYVEIVRYAAARHIEVIPEIEMPGHARAAIKSMKSSQQFRLDEPEDRSVYMSVQGYPDNVMNPALESTYRF